jgi:hypothetical protein
MIKIDSSYKYPIFFFALIALISFCEISNSQETRADQCAATIPVGGTVSVLCETQPTIQSIIFHKVAFCTAIPTAPTLTAATVMTNCSTVFENTAGATVSIEKGVGAIPAGTFTDPPNGTYTYAYVELSPTITYKANLVFNAGTGALAQSSLGGAEIGPNCHTNGTAYRYWDFLKGITCTGNVVTEAVDTINFINSFDNNEALYGGTLNDGTNPGITHLYLIQSNGTLASGATSGTDGNVAKLIFFLPMTANITADTTSYNLLYANERGMIVWKNADGAGNFRIGFSAAYFDMIFEIK